MAAGAERLPVAGVPKQSLVSAMRPDVIHAVSWRDPAHALALGAQRMLSEPGAGGGAPSGSVAPLVRGASGAVSHRRGWCAQGAQAAVRGLAPRAPAEVLMMGRRRHCCRDHVREHFRLKMFRRQECAGWGSGVLRQTRQRYARPAMRARVYLYLYLYLYSRPFQKRPMKRFKTVSSDFKLLISLVESRKCARRSTKTFRSKTSTTFV